MSSHEGFAGGLIVPVRLSAPRLLLSAVIHGLGLLALLSITPLSVMMTGFLALALLLSLIHDLLQYGWVPQVFRQPLRGLISQRLVQLQYIDGRWRGLFDDGVSLELELTGLLYTGRWFLILRFRSQGHRTVMPLVIGRDTVSADLYRRMGVVLRFAQR